MSIETGGSGIPDDIASRRAEFEAQGMVMVAGHLSLGPNDAMFRENPNNSGILNVRAPLDSETVRLIQRTPGAVIGPYFLGDTYYPEGVGIWAPRPPQA